MQECVCSRSVECRKFAVCSWLQSSVIRCLCSSKRCRLKLLKEFQMQKQQRCQGAGRDFAVVWFCAA